jgi:3-hydroxyisobutyrate dehydrogenase-like beta-hydroxyacid dehydrogenase
MVANDQALEEVVMGAEGIGEALGRGGVHVSMSRVSPATARKLAEIHRRHGGAYVAAPVFGRPEAAAAKKLWICAAGPQLAKERVQPVLQALRQAIYDLGEEPAAANVVKLATGRHTTPYSEFFSKNSDLKFCGGVGMSGPPLWRKVHEIPIRPHRV